jgi:hypothetical protein
MYRSLNFIGNHRSKITSSIIISNGIIRQATDVYNFQILSSIIHCTPHLLKDQPEDGPTTGPKHVAKIITYHNLIKYKVVYHCIIYFLYYILLQIFTHENGYDLESCGGAFCSST